MKGGEMMHIRHFIISGLMLGAAVFFPEHAFAEKNGLSGQPELKSSIVQSETPEKAENAKALEKTMPITPEPEVKSQNEVHQNPADQTSSKQTATIKPETKSLNMPERAIDKAQSSLIKNVKADKAPEPSAKGKHLGPSKTKNVPDKLLRNPTLRSLHNADSKAEANRQSPNAKSEPLGEGSHSSIAIKIDRSQNLAQKPLIDGENKTSSNNKKFPGTSKIIKSLTQRTQTTGGQSNDRVSTGTSTLSYVEKWFEWVNHYELKFGQAYILRQALYCNQWVNAPPSPPPKETPFYLTYTAAN